MICHERASWVRHVLAIPGGPDLQGDLADVIQRGVDTKGRDWSCIFHRLHCVCHPWPIQGSWIPVQAPCRLIPPSLRLLSTR